jgi:hypothetical protein
MTQARGLEVREGILAFVAQVPSRHNVGCACLGLAPHQRGISRIALSGCRSAFGSRCSTGFVLLFAVLARPMRADVGRPHRPFADKGRPHRPFAAAASVAGAPLRLPVVLEWRLDESSRFGVGQLTGRIWLAQDPLRRTLVRGDSQTAQTASLPRFLSVHLGQLHCCSPFSSSFLTRWEPQPRACSQPG